MDFIKKILYRKPVILIALGLILALSAGSSFYFYRQYKKAVQNSTDYSKEQVKDLVTQVGKLIMLPTDEDPTIASITDKSRLKDQPFFIEAENGDRVLIYTKAKKAILYRPSENIIVNVAPVSLGATPSAEVKQEVTFELRNGTPVVGLTKKYEAELKEKVTNAVVSDRNNAAKSDYAATLLIDTSREGNPGASAVAQVLGLTLSKLPDGEATSAAQFVIIVGEDKK